MDIKIVQKSETISRDEVRTLALATYGDLVKAVVDLEKGIMAIGCEMHFDAEQLLLEQESRQDDLWGINLHPDKSGEDFIEFDSMINLRPSHGNRSRGVDDPTTQQKIRNLVTALVL